MSQRRIGLIGGLSWYSSADYYHRINQLVRQRLGGHHSADCVVLSLEEQRFLDATAHDPLSAAAVQMLCGAVRDLQAIGCEVIAFTANGVHRFVQTIEEQTGVRILSIIDAVAQHLLDEGVRCVGLLGTGNTMRLPFYRQRLGVLGVTAIVPDEAGIHQMDALIMDELTLGIFRDETRASVLSVCETLKSRGAERVILGCTELPMLLSDAHMQQAGLLSSMEVHCQAIVAAALQAA